MFFTPTFVRDPPSPGCRVPTMPGVPSPPRAGPCTERFRYPAGLAYSSATADHGGQRGRQAHGIVPWRTVGLGDGSQDQFRAAVVHR